MKTRPFSKPSKSERLEGNPEYRSAAYSNVREHSSTEPTYQKTDYGELLERSTGDI
ncbi:MAG: palindromic element RPE1 domain-containing protein [Holosporales bacterium]|nr:palindromic element RPE1 domain-containing protein [Holosporales bacterium]